MAKKIASVRLDDELNPTEAMVKLAQAKKLTAHQIHRVAERANKNVLVQMNKRAAANQIDPHFSVEPIKVAEVLALLEMPPPAQATPPPPRGPQVDVKTVMPDPEGLPEEDSSSMHPDEAMEHIEEHDAPPENLDENDAMGVLGQLEEKVDQAKRALMDVERQMNDAITRFKKEAYQQLQAGTPLEALEAIPHGDGHIQKVAQQMHDRGDDVPEAGRTVEIDYDHPLCKLAEDIAALEAQHHDRQEVLATWQRRRNDIQRRLT